MKWHIAKKLVAKPFLDREVEPVREAYEAANGQVKHRTADWQPSDNVTAVRYRPISNGDLIAWEQPIGPVFATLAHPVDLADALKARPENPTRSQVQYALSRLSVKISPTSQLTCAI
ncbi:hypothetical protein SUDANB106_04329 [Streptomyces sp. enrichment culture]|uniref:hypothetical protein n=1 Tax=Streptomyces sp. enrichment culture TaxID=1795815 RepID=UPI003F576201